jgi:peptide/nickel transport system substrate-binding protein
MHSRKLIVLFIVFVLLLALAACAAPSPTPVPTVAPKPTEVTKPTAVAGQPTSAPQPTATPPPTAAPTATAGPKRGGKVTMAVWQSPTILNPLLSSQTVMNEVLTFIVEGMTSVQPDGKRVPTLAKEVPTLENGGVSADGKTITYKLKEGVLWSNGTPFTCEDVKFTWQARTTPGIGIMTMTGYSDIETVECPNPFTVILKFKSLYVPYITLFPEILPKSAGDPKDMKNWKYNRNPIGTGPFKVLVKPDGQPDFVSDDHIILVRNENYREKDKPYLDQIVVRIVPSVDIGLQLLASGEADVLWSIPVDNTPQMDKMPGVKYSAPPRMGGERILLNLAENKNPSDPTKPHQVLGDIKVRQAFALAINKQRIVDRLLYSQVALLASDLNMGPYACDNIKPYPYDPVQAKKLLDEAGWVPGPDGIRIAKGSRFAPDGTRLRLKYSTISGDKLRENIQALVMQDLKAVGIEVYIENAPLSVIVGTWDANSPTLRGNFDLVQYSTGVTGGAAGDPNTLLPGLYGSWSIPSEQNKGGYNITRFSNPQADEWLKQAEKELDQNKRKALYCQVAQLGYDSYNIVYLYQAGRAYAYRERLQGWIANGSNNVGWNAQDWWVK